MLYLPRRTHSFLTTQPWTYPPQASQPASTLSVIPTVSSLPYREKKAGELPELEAGSDLLRVRNKDITLHVSAHVYSSRLWKGILSRGCVGRRGRWDQDLQTRRESSGSEKDELLAALTRKDTTLGG